jgi:two-component system chemotaxis sensor kinase CheA
MYMDFSDEIPGFLIESDENLSLLDSEMVQLEKRPADEALIASVFRTIHTIKGTSGFFGFSLLGSVTHVTENILGQVREKQRAMTPELVSLILRTVDAVRLILENIESSGKEGPDEYEPLRRELNAAFQACARAIDVPEMVSEDDLDHLLAAMEREGIPEPVTSAQSAARQVKTEIAPVGPASPLIASAAIQVSDAADPPQNRRAEDGLLSQSTIRVEVSLLDKLMNLVGELVLARNQILQGAAQSVGANATSQRLNLITTELQEGVMRTRMQPIGTVWSKLPRVVRDLASELGKKIELEMEGADTELDKTIIEAIKDPLTHIVRNSCDHGIESHEARVAKGKPACGTIWLRAFHEGGHVNIEISDDGAGLDPEKLKTKAIQKGLIRAEQAATLSEWEALRLILLPGFSTAEKISNISGRGVGMDVVKTNIEKISGTVDMTNRQGGGTTIKIKIPLTLAIIPGLIVSVRNEAAGALKLPRMHRFVIPQANLLELVRLEGDKSRNQIERIHGVEVYRRRGKLLPLAYLNEVLGVASSRSADSVRNIVIVRAEDTAFGLIVDEVNDTQEIVVKALGKQLKGLSCYVGATIMGDGKIALILDITGIARLANMLSHSAERGRSDSASESHAAEARQMLLFRSGRFSRLVLDLSLVSRLEEISTSRIEYAAGLPVVRYREALLPLVSLSALLDPGGTVAATAAECRQVIVFNEGDRFVGLVVDEILDIVDDIVTIKQPSAAFGLLGSGVVGGKVTDFVDVDAILAAANAYPAGHLPATRESRRTLLLVHPSKITRGALRSYLEMHGHVVLDAPSLECAIEILGHTRVDLVITSTDLNTNTGDDLVKAIRSRVGLISLPVIGLAGDAKSLPAHPLFEVCLPIEDRESLLPFIQTLSQHDFVPAASEYEYAGSLP